MRCILEKPKRRTVEKAMVPEVPQATKGVLMETICLQTMVRAAQDLGI